MADPKSRAELEALKSRKFRALARHAKDAGADAATTSDAGRARIEKPNVGTP